MKTKGFTLIELLVVISIISLLSSVVLASVRDAREKASQKAFRVEINQLVTALELHKANYGTYPYEKNSTFSGQAYFFQKNTDNTEGSSDGMSKLSEILSAKLPRVPQNSLTNLPVWYYMTNYTNNDVRRRCSGQKNLPPYVIVITNNHPLLFDAFSDLPSYETSFPPYDNWTEVSSNKCFSLN